MQRKILTFRLCKPLWNIKTQDNTSLGEIILVSKQVTVSASKHKMSSDLMVEGLSKAENIGYAKINADLVIEHVNPSFYRIVGVDPSSDLTGQELSHVLKNAKLNDVDTNAQVSLSSLFERISKTEATNNEQRTTVLLTSQDGRLIRLNCWHINSGVLIATARDVTEERHRISLLEMAMDAADAGFWSMNFETGKFTFSESVTRRLNATEIEKMQSEGVWAIVHKDDLTTITTTWQNILAGNADFDMTYRVETEKDGIKWQHSVGQLERGIDGKVLAATAFVKDITDDVKKQSDLVTAKEASKAKSEFLARMSHEIRTPLNAIIGMSDSLKEEDLSEDIMEVIEDIEQAAEGLHQLLSRTLDHAKLISDKMQIDLHRDNIRDVVSTSTKLWNPQCSASGISLNTHFDPKLPDQFLLDGFRLQQCLNNLLSNAVKFTQSGRIDVIVKTAVFKEQDSLIIAVKDTGIGMTAEQSKSIFDEFMQADNSISRTYGGTGLGMSITKQLTELMGGEVRVKSELGAGSTFALVLPILEDDHCLTSVDVKTVHQVPTTLDTPDKDAAESLDRSEPPKPFEGLSVLCVEDNPVNQKVVKRLIGKRVENLRFANNGREALDVLGVLHVDVVLMDIHMPIMDGIETTLEIRGSKEPWANVVIIALTADPNYQQKRICKNIGMDDTIAKPVKREDILKAFDRTLGTISPEFTHPVKLTA